MRHRTTVLAAVAALALAFPEASHAGLLSHAIGVEAETVPSLSLRFEWRPLSLVMPSISVGLARSASGQEGMLVTARVTTEPFTLLGLLGLTGEVGLRGVFAQGGLQGVLEIGVGVRVHLSVIDLFLEGGLEPSAGKASGFATLGLMVPFD